MKNIICALGLLFAVGFIAAPAAHGAVKVSTASLSGSYTGVVKLPNGATLSGAGTLSVAGNGRFTAKVTAFGKTFQTSGKLDALGRYSGDMVTTFQIGGYSFTVKGIKITLHTITDFTGTWLKATGTLGTQTITVELRKTA